MTKQLRIWTARVDYTGEENEVVLNTTAKSAKGLGQGFRANVGDGHGT